MDENVMKVQIAVSQIFGYIHNRNMVLNAVSQLLNVMPERKKLQYEHECGRNCDFTTYYGLPRIAVEVHEHGVMLRLWGTRSSFRIFATRDGKFMKKPNCSKALTKVDYVLHSKLG